MELKLVEFPHEFLSREWKRSVIKLSIVTPTLSNPSQFISSLLDSFFANKNLDHNELLSQFELVIVTPKKNNFTNHNFENLQVTLAIDNGKGIYDALNMGVEAAKGLYFIVINTDDFIHINKLLEVVNQDLNGTSIFYGDTFIHDDVSSEIISVPGSRNPDTISDLRMPGSHQAQLIPRSEFQRLGGFRTQVHLGPLRVSLKYASDLDFYCRSFKSGTEWKYIEDLIAHQWLGGTTSKHWLRTTTEILLCHFIHEKDSHSRLRMYTKTYLGASRFHYPRQRARRAKAKNKKP
jgi:glycosyltransferase involved in cell wall biosynthesis